MTKSHLKALLHGTTALVGRISAYEFGETDSLSNRGRKHICWTWKWERKKGTERGRL